MSAFGDALRSFRQGRNDPERLNRRLSQERLGSLIGEILDDGGVTGATVSYWESGKSRIGTDDRVVLLALVKALNMCGGIKVLKEANHLLELGNYRPLNQHEAFDIFGDDPTIEATASSDFLFLVENMFAVSEKEFKNIIAQAKRDNHKPIWPRILAAVMRNISDKVSISRITILWVWVGILTWWLITPSLRLPFTDNDSMIWAMTMYMTGSLLVPLCVGLLTNTKDNDYWKAIPSVSSALLRLYTYQGAGVGFNVGYFLVLPIAFVLYYLGFDSSPFVSVLVVGISLLLSAMSALVVPHNLWHAYGRLAFLDGAIFFVVAFMGPIWGFFFLEFSSTLLDPIAGIFVTVAAITILVFRSTRQPKTKSTS